MLTEAASSGTRPVTVMEWLARIELAATDLESESGDVEEAFREGRRPSPLGVGRRSRGPRPSLAPHRDDAQLAQSSGRVA